MTKVDRNFKISLIRGDKGEIKATSNFRALVRKMLQDEKLVKHGGNLARFATEDEAAYKAAKDQSPGFVIGEFSYRDEKSCLRYEPVIGFDVDHIEGSEYKNALAKLKRWPFTFVAFPSISQKGIRVLVYTKSTKDTHKEYYAAIAQSLRSLLGIPTKTEIRENLKSIGFDRVKIEAFLNENAHIDDVTSDICRFWFYSGLQKNQLYVNQESEVFELSASKIASEPQQRKSSTSGDYAYTFTDEDKISYLVDQLEAKRIDITAGVPEWFKVGLALYDALGDYAQGYFERVSQFHPDYSSSSCAREWGRVRSKYKPGTVTVATFYRWCSDAGVTLDFDELKDIHSDKFSQAKASRSSNNQLPEVHATPDLDAVVIATCIKKPVFIESIADVAPKFAAACFSTGDAQVVYSAIETLIRDSMTVSAVSVRAKLQHAGQDETIVDKFTVVSPSLDDFLTNIRLLYSQYIKRTFVETAQNAIGEISEPDIDGIGFVSDFVDVVDSLTDMEAKSTQVDGSELALSLLADYKTTVEAKKKNKNAITGIPTGLRDLDKLTSGWQDTDLIIEAARPGMGKTALALKHIIATSIDNNLPSAFYSLEMSSLQLGKRIASIRAEVEGIKVKNGELSDWELDRYFKACEEVEKAPIFIDDKPGQTISYIRSSAKRIKRKHGLSLVVIDYLQLMGVPRYMRSNDANTTVGYNSKKCKELAKELGVPVILLSQLSRAVETRGGDKRPQLSDLRESGSIEQDADMVIFIYRPEYYQIMEDEEGNSLKGIADLIVAKHRNGPLDDVTVGWDGKYTKFWDGVQDEYKPVKAATVEAEPQPAYNPSISPQRNDDDDIPF